MGTDNQNSQEQTQTEEKTFTQAELDAVVKDRLKREREKYADYDAVKAKATKLDEIEAANKSELEKANEKAAKLEAELNGIKKAAELREMREKIATENNIPANLLTGTSEEECKAQVESIKGLLSANGIPTSVSDGGEPNHSGKVSNQTMFANWVKDKI
jgi:hypothetical protein